MIIKLLPYQMEFLQSSEKFVWLCAGLGSGKSYALAHYCIQRMLTNPETVGLICAATYSQLRDSILNELFRQLGLLGLTYDYSSLTGYIQLHCNGSRVKTFSLENYEILRGIEVGWIAIDEACLAREDAYKVAIGRLRCKHSKALECRIVSTPKGFDYLYDRYVGEKYSAGHRLIHATAYMNPHLPDGYLESLAAGYEPRMFKQEVLAEFVSNAQGVIYYAFDRAQHVQPAERRLALPVWVGMDFNVNPMTAALANVSNGAIYVFDEKYLTHSNTYAMRDDLRKSLPHTTIKVAPDATGRANKTSATQSDHEILRGAGFDVVTRKRNPPVEDRWNTVNTLLRQGRIFIDPRCKMLIRDLERVTHESNPDYLTHISDAFGYLAWHLFPVKKPRRESSQHQL